MDLKDLLCDSGRRTIDLATAFVGDDSQRFGAMLEFALEDEPQYAMRAIRVVNQVGLNHPGHIRPYLPGLILDLEQYKNEGLRRGILKTVSEHPLDYGDDVLGTLVDVCFRWFPDPNEAVSVKVYALEILYRVSQQLPELKDELLVTIEEEIPRATRGMQSRCRRVLGRLQKEKSM